MVGYLLSILFLAFVVVVLLGVLLSGGFLSSTYDRDDKIIKTLNQIPYLVFSQCRVYFTMELVHTRRYGYLERVGDSGVVKIVFSDRGNEIQANLEYLLDTVVFMKRLGTSFYKENLFHKQFFSDKSSLS